MKKTSLKFQVSIFILLAALSAQSAVRPISATWDIQNGNKRLQDINFFQAESVQLTLASLDGTNSYRLTNSNLIVVWEITGWNDYTNTYSIATGTVVSATNGLSSYTLTPAQANLSPGTYRGFVRALQTVSNQLEQVAVLAWQRIKVEYSPDSRNYNLVAPLPAPGLYGYTNTSSHLWFLSSSARRTLNLAWKTEVGQTQKQAVNFFQAESIQLNETFTLDGAALDLSDTNTVYAWEITGWSDYTNTYALCSGYTTGTVVRFELPPWQSNLRPGTYRGFVRALKGSDSNLVQGAVLAYQLVTVEYAPDSRHYSIVGPYTQPIYYTTNVIVGPQGPAGTNGVDGAQGPQGPAGTNGVDGAQGPQGPAGTNGVDGTQGPQGIQGEIGPQGPQGIQGPAGTNDQAVINSLSNRVTTLEAGAVTNLNQLLMQSELFTAETFDGTWYSAGTNIWTNAAGWRAVGADVATPGQIFMDASDEYVVSPKIHSGYSYSVIDYYKFWGAEITVETSPDGTNWTPGAAVGTNVVVRYSFADGWPEMGAPPYVTLYSAGIYDFIDPSQYGETNNFVGRKVIVDEAVENGNPVPLSQFNAGMVANSPQIWSQYPALKDVTLNGNRMMWDSNYYTVGSATNEAGTPTLQIGWNRNPIIQVFGGETEFVNPYITLFSCGATTTTLRVLGSSGWRPVIEYRTNLLAGAWDRMATNDVASTYPDLADGQYTLTWPTPVGNPLRYYRTIASNDTGATSGGTNLVLIRYDLQVDGDIINAGFQAVQGLAYNAVKGATITGGSVNSITTNSGVLAITVQTNAPDIDPFLTNGQTGVTLNMLGPNNGFESQYAQTVAFNPITRTATITPTGSTFRVTAGGVTYTSGAITSTVADAASGGKYCYIATNGQFVATNAPWTINGEAQAIFAQYFAGTTSTVLTVDERHGIGITDTDHRARHLSVGSRFSSGLGLFHNAQDATTPAASATGSNTMISISAGAVFDEDVEHTTVTNGPQSNTAFSLTSAGVFPILYKTNSLWMKQAGTVFPFSWSVDTPRYVSANGSFVNVSEDQYFVYFLMVLGSADGTNCFLISDYQTYPSTQAAQTTSSVARLSTLISGLPTTEMICAYRLIFQYNQNGTGGNPDAVKRTKLRDVTDFRYVSSGLLSINSQSAPIDDDSMYLMTNGDVSNVTGTLPAGVLGTNVSRTVGGLTTTGTVSAARFSGGSANLSALAVVDTNAFACISGGSAGTFAGAYYFAGTDVYYGDFYTNSAGKIMSTDVDYNYSGSWQLGETVGSATFYFDGLVWYDENVNIVGVTSAFLVSVDISGGAVTAVGDVGGATLKSSGDIYGAGSLLLGTLNRDYVPAEGWLCLNMPGGGGIIQYDKTLINGSEDGTIESAAAMVSLYEGGLRLMLVDVGVTSGEITGVGYISGLVPMTLYRDRIVSFVPIMSPKIKIADAAGETCVIATDRADAAVGELYVDGTNETVKIRLN